MTEKFGRDAFITDDSDDPGIRISDLAEAVQTWSFMRGRSSVREAADTFNTTDDVIREAVTQHYWMFLRGPDDDATKQTIEHEGE